MLKEEMVLLPVSHVPQLKVSNYKADKADKFLTGIMIWVLSIGRRSCR
jgi:hypothetical protein